MRTISHAMTIALLAGSASVSAVAQDATPALTRVLGAREQMLAAFDAMPMPRLQQFFLLCNREASERLLDLADAVGCAMATDALLKRRFAGDFNAMLAWWRVERDAVARR